MPIKRTALPLYRQIIHDAWRLSLTHKHLWIFGFFATFIGFGGASEVLLGVYDRMTSVLPYSMGSGQSPMMMLPGFATMRAMVNLSPYPAITLAFFTILALLLLAVFAYIISLSIGALVFSIRKVERGGEPTFSEGLKAGSTTVGRVLAINAGAKIAMWLAFALTGANLMQLLVNKSFISMFFFLVSFVLFTILALAVSVLSVYATNSAVNGGLPIVPSLADGLKILKSSWLVSIEMAVILMVINAGIAIIATLAAMIVSVPLVFIFFVAALIKSGTMMTMVMTITIIVLVTILFVAVSFLTTLQASAWTLLWIRLGGREKHRPKILRLAEWFQNKLTQ